MRSGVGPSADEASVGTGRQGTGERKTGKNIFGKSSVRGDTGGNN